MSTARKMTVPCILHTPELIRPVIALIVGLHLLPQAEAPRVMTAHLGYLVSG